MNGGLWAIAVCCVDQLNPQPIADIPASTWSDPADTFKWSPITLKEVNIR